MNLEFWKKLKEEYGEDDLLGTDAARIKRAKQTPGQETVAKDKITKEDCGCMNEEEKKGPTNVTNALFVGSTADLAKLIKQQNTKKD